MIGRYDDALFALVALFNIDGSVSRVEFSRAAQRLAERSPGAQAFEWVPAVPSVSRHDVEEAMAHTHRRPFEFTERNSAGALVRAARQGRFGATLRGKLEGLARLPAALRERRRLAASGDLTRARTWLGK